MCSFVTKCNCNTSSKRSLKWLYKVVRMRPQSRRCIFCFLLVLRWQQFFCESKWWDCEKTMEISVGVSHNSDLQHFFNPTRKPHTKMERKQLTKLVYQRRSEEKWYSDRRLSNSELYLFVSFILSFSFHNSYRLPIRFLSSMSHSLEMIGLLAGVLASFGWSRFHLKKRMDTTRLNWHLVLCFRLSTGLLGLWGFLEELNRKGTWDFVSSIFNVSRFIHDTLTSNKKNGFLKSPWIETIRSTRASHRMSAKLVNFWILDLFYGELSRPTDNVRFHFMNKAASRSEYCRWTKVECERCKSILSAWLGDSWTMFHPLSFYIWFGNQIF